MSPTFPNGKKSGEKKSRRSQENLKQKHADALRPSQFLWANIRKRRIHSE